MVAISALPANPSSILEETMDLIQIPSVVVHGKTHELGHCMTKPLVLSSCSDLSPNSDSSITTSYAPVFGSQTEALSVVSRNTPHASMYQW